MTSYKVMARKHYGKRYENMNDFVPMTAILADKQASRLAASSLWEAVKVIVTDSNGITNELQYK